LQGSLVYSGDGNLTNEDADIASDCETMDIDKAHKLYMHIMDRCWGCGTLIVTTELKRDVSHPKY
jgi:hypothetical protein